MSFERQVVLITGAGSFGTAMLKEILTQNPTIIRVVDNNESALVKLKQELGDNKIRYMLADIRDRPRLIRLFDGVETVIHSAALKHVDLCEYNPSEAIRTNVDGSLNVVEAAIACKVLKVLGISSDKAVHPINTYGATKLVMEKLFTDANGFSKTKFSCARFGNFWDSSNNVITIWKQQKVAGKPITITDPHMSRYFINMDEAIDFTGRCVDWMQGGEIFIPLMPLHTLQEMARDLVPECQVNIIGARRGEKRTEELYTEDEARHLERRKDCLVIKY